MNFKIILKRYRDDIEPFISATDNVFHGITKRRIDEYKKGEITLHLVALTTREKIYNAILAILLSLKKRVFLADKFERLQRQVRVHINQLRLLKQPNIEENLKFLNAIIHIIKMNKDKLDKLVYLENYKFIK